MFAKNVGQGGAGGEMPGATGDRDAQLLEDLKLFQETVEVKGRKDNEEKDSYFMKDPNELRYTMSDEVYDFFKTKHKKNFLRVQHEPTN